jgi:hypothetical protein
MLFTCFLLFSLGYQVNPHDLAPERAGLIAGIVKIGGVAGIILPNVVQFMTQNHVSTVTPTTMQSIYRGFCTNLGDL